MAAMADHNVDATVARIMELLLPAPADIAASFAEPEHYANAQAAALERAGRHPARTGHGTERLDAPCRPHVEIRVDLSAATVDPSYLVAMCTTSSPPTA